MSTSAQVLVFRVADPAATGARVLEHLVRAEIVEAKRTDCVMRGRGHRPGARVDAAVGNVTELAGVSANGLAIETPRDVTLYFCPDGGKPWVSCAACRWPLEEDAFARHLRKPLFRRRKSPKCPHCGDVRPIEDWVTHDSAFGNLALFFWSWWLRDEFIRDVITWAERPLVLVDYTL